jgi:DNA-binding NarL/FixJ family response regulator
MDAHRSAVRILLVDDDSGARFLIRAILGDHPEDFRIVGETAHAEEATALAEETDAEVVLLDAMMPLIDGYELAGRILAARPATRLVLLSSYVDEEVRDRARAAGIHACLDKRFFDQIPRAVREVLDGR